MVLKYMSDRPKGLGYYSYIMVGMPQSDIMLLIIWNICWDPVMWKNIQKWQLYKKILRW